MNAMRYAGDLAVWAGLHVLWQGAIVMGSVGLLLESGSTASVRHRYAIVGATILLGLFAIDLGGAHLALLLDADRTASRVPTLPSSWLAVFSGTLDRGFAYLSTVGWVWCIGTAGVMLRFIHGAWRVGLMRARSLPAPPSLVDRVAMLASTMGVRHVPEVRYTCQEMPPCVMGIGRGVLFLSSTLTDGEAMDLLIRHELAHLERHDVRTSLLLQFCALALWWHPALHWFKRRVEETRELICDEMAAATPLQARTLAHALVQLEDRRQQYSTMLGATDGDLLRRVRALLARASGSASTPPTGPRTRYGVAVIALTLLSCWAPVRFAPFSDRMAVSVARSGLARVESMVVDARDDAGTFQLIMLNGRVASATAQGINIADDAIRREGDVVRLLAPSGAPIVALWLDRRTRAIRWQGRPGTTSSLPTK